MKYSASSFGYLLPNIWKSCSSDNVSNEFTGLVIMKIVVYYVDGYISGIIVNYAEVYIKRH